MPRVITEKKISGLSIDTVWLIARDLESYPKFMDQVKSVEFIDAVEGVITSSWVVLFNGNELRWTEVDEWSSPGLMDTIRIVRGECHH
ncbi:MAG: SRPBCC family protein, partial [Rhizobiaceae bacterium]|nr:SRPBCC family protein [Rhizobiaceae bacterium]